MLGDAIFLLAAITVPLLAGSFTYGLLRGSPAIWSRRGWPRLLACNLMALVALASSIHLFAEFYYRFWYDTTDGINVSRASIRWFERHWSTNAQKVRDDVDYRTRIAPSQYRITFIGDSFTAAQGIADVGRRFANLVRAAKPGWDVHVFAGLGWNTGDETQKSRVTGASRKRSKSYVPDMHSACVNASGKRQMAASALKAPIEEPPTIMPMSSDLQSVRIAGTSSSPMKSTKSTRPVRSIYRISTFLKNSLDKLTFHAGPWKRPRATLVVGTG